LCGYQLALARRSCSVYRTLVMSW